MLIAATAPVAGWLGPLVLVGMVTLFNIFLVNDEC